VVAIIARIAIVVWASSRFPPTADGTFYHRIAERIAQGLGYTWLWPDGSVTYAAHYPVGYPALVGAVYAITGPHPASAMVLNAALGALAAVASYRLALRATRPRVALVAGLLVALHPGLVAYTPALMSEGVTAALVTAAAWAAASARDAAERRASELPWARLVVLGLVVGVATLVRPQSIVFAPIFSLLALSPLVRVAAVRRVFWGAALATITGLAVCAPWTARNCARMGRCSLVSVNGGWNLLIGADVASTGAWSPIKVPDTCREVWDEAGKDECFGRAAALYIMEHPATWLSLVPRKLAATFDYCGAAGWYLHDANSAACDDRCKIVLGAAETLYERVILALALLWAALSAHTSSSRPNGTPQPLVLQKFVLKQFSLRVVLTSVVVAIGIGSLFHVHAWVAHLALVLAALISFRSLFAGPLLASAAVCVLGATMLTHVVFFGAGRYGLVTFPLVAALAALVFGSRRVEGAGASGPLPVSSETPAMAPKSP
jgi:4-amino-4-deoxy-L-arabinose transferase-like glycosyltransferase